MPLLAAAPASATTNPPWEPDTNALGTLTFYDASGNVVTGGSDLTHLFAFAQGSTQDTTGGTKAVLYFANPQPSQNSELWPTNQDTGSLGTVQPAAGVPAPIDNTFPVVNVSGATAANLSAFIHGQVANTQSGYANVWQIRVYSVAPGGGGSLGNGTYWESDVVVDLTAGTWLEEYPTQGSTATATTTALTAAPVTGANQHQSVTLTAAVSAADLTHPAGSVEFFEDGLSIGTSPVDTSTGDATLTTSALLPSAPGQDDLTATFTPTDQSTYATSNSATLHYTINPVASKPSISGPHRVGAAEKCAEGGLTYGVKAAYAWTANGTKIGTGGSFVVPASALNKSLACVATVQAGSGPKSSATSSTVKVVLGAPLKPTKKPVLSGPHKVGKKETVSSGTWSPRATKYKYQWLVNGKPISGATKSSLTLPKSTRGKKVSCKVTAMATGYANGVFTTAAVKAS
jgi:hypothetical protein